MGDEKRWTDGEVKECEETEEASEAAEVAEVTSFERDRRRVVELQAAGKKCRRLSLEERVEKLEEVAGLSPIVED